MLMLVAAPTAEAAPACLAPVGTDNGAVIRARAIRHGHRRAFLLIAQGAKLPGSVQALATGGTVIRTMKFDSAAELCKSAQGIANPVRSRTPSNR
jgi:hypothetical protein